MVRQGSEHCMVSVLWVYMLIIDVLLRSGSTLDFVLFRVGIIAGLRSKKLDGKTVGVVVTASHNPEAVRWNCP